MRIKKLLGGLLIGTLMAGATLVAPGGAAMADPGPSRIATTAQKHSVLRLYQAYFLRDPDSRGYAYWAEEFSSRRMSLGSISQSFSQSPEFVERYGSLSHSDFVKLVYQNVLGRSPDSKGLAHWVGALQVYPHRGSVMIGFSESVEFQKKTDTVAPEVYQAPAAHCGTGCVPESAKGALIACRIPVHGNAPVKGGTGVEPYLEEFANLTGIEFVPASLTEAKARGIVFEHAPVAGMPVPLGQADVRWIEYSDGSKFLYHTTITLFEETVSPWTLRHEIAHALGLEHSRTPLMSPAGDIEAPESIDIRLDGNEQAHLAGLGRRSGCR